MSSGEDKQQKETLQHSMTLTNLPVEILSNIFTLLLPPGIVTLGRCCRALRQVSNGRQLWSISLKSASFESKIFLPTYPIAAMSTVDLKRACTRRWKLRHHVWNGHQLLEPTRVQTLLPYMGVAANNVELVPGGRFLLTTDTIQRLCLWDLGYGQNTLFSQEPLAMKQFSGPGILGVTPLLMHPTTDGTGVVCCVNLSVDDWESSLGEVHIVEIYPTSNHPQFHIIGSHQLIEDEDSVDCHTITSEFFGYRVNDQLVLWNFRNNTKHRIACDGEADGMLILNEAVLVLTLSGYNIFSLPYSESTSTSEAVGQIELISSASFLSAADEFSLPPTWYDTALEPTCPGRQQVHVDAVMRNDEESWRIHRYTLSTSTTVPNPLSSTFRFTHDTPDATKKLSCNVMISHTMPGDERWLVWPESRFLNLNVSHGSNIWETSSRWLYRRERDEVDWDGRWGYSFCPFAARACTLSFRGEIKIIDLM